MCVRVHAQTCMYTCMHIYIYIYMCMLVPILFALQHLGPDENVTDFLFLHHFGRAMCICKQEKISKMSVSVVLICNV